MQHDTETILSEHHIPATHTIIDLYERLERFCYLFHGNDEDAYNTIQAHLMACQFYCDHAGDDFQPETLFTLMLHAQWAGDGVMPKCTNTLLPYMQQRLLDRLRNYNLLTRNMLHHHQVDPQSWMIHKSVTIAICMNAADQPIGIDDNDHIACEKFLANGLIVANCMSAPAFDTAYFHQISRLMKKFHFKVGHYPNIYKKPELIKE